jgi:hypothetical protein
MKQGTFWTAGSRSTSQKITHLSLNQKIHYRFRRNSSQVPNQSHLNPIQTITTYSFNVKSLFLRIAPWRRMGEWRYSSKHSYPRHWMLSGSLTLQLLYPQRRSSRTQGLDYGWVPEPIWTPWRGLFPLSEIEFQFLGRPTLALVYIRVHFSKIHFNIIFPSRHISVPFKYSDLNCARSSRGSHACYMHS